MTKCALKYIIRVKLRKGEIKLNNVTRIRQRLNLTQQELADKLGFTRSYIWKIENDERQTSYEFIKALKEKMPELDTNIFFN